MTQEYRTAREAAEKRYAQASADQLINSIMAALLTDDLGMAQTDALFAELLSRLHQLDGIKMGAEESPWKRFSEQWPESTEPVLIRCLPHSLDFMPTGVGWPPDYIREGYQAWEWMYIPK